MRRLALLLLLIAASPATADDAQPWATGVSEERKAAAQKLLEAGNLQFVEKKYTEALARYTEAISQWDHPAIRFNVVRCLIQLERYVEADENLQKALKYGAAPLEDNVYREAQSYQKLLGQQVVQLDIACKQAGVKLTLDGEALGACPTTVSRRVRAGRHQVVGVKQGFMTKTDDLVLVGGEQKAVDVALIPLERAARIEHRWPTWVPWVVFVGGLTVGGIGGLVQLKASSDMKSFDRDVANNCDNGCTEEELDPDTRDRRDLANLESTIGISVISVGAAAAVTGGVLLYLNRGRTVYPNERRQVGIVPTAGGAAVTFGGRF